MEGVIFSHLPKYVNTTFLLPKYLKGIKISVYNHLNEKNVSLYSGNKYKYNWTPYNELLHEFADYKTVYNNIVFFISLVFYYDCILIKYDKIKINFFNNGVISVHRGVDFFPNRSDPTTVIFCKGKPLEERHEQANSSGFFVYIDVNEDYTEGEHEFIYLDTQGKRNCLIYKVDGTRITVNPDEREDLINEIERVKEDPLNYVIKWFVGAF